MKSTITAGTLPVKDSSKESRLGLYVLLHNRGFGNEVGANRLQCSATASVDRFVHRGDFVSHRTVFAFFKNPPSTPTPVWFNHVVMAVPSPVFLFKYMCPRERTLTHTHTHARTHARTHAHTHTYCGNGTQSEKRWWCGKNDDDRDNKNVHIKASV